jgi:hypothetical protein
MCGPMLLLAAASIGVDFGWQPIAGGGVEYIIQIEPELLESLASGRADIVSEIPPFLRGVRSYRITVGTGPLPHQGEPPPLQEAAEPDENEGMPGPGGDPFEGSFGGVAAKPLRRPALRDDHGSDVNPAGYEETDDADEQATHDGPDGKPAKGGAGAAGGAAGRSAAGNAAAGEAAGGEDEPSPSDQDSPPAETAPSRPWLPLGLALVALCASLAANAYQGWVTLALRQRYLLLLARGSQQ